MRRSVVWFGLSAALVVSGVAFALWSSCSVRPRRTLVLVKPLVAKPAKKPSSPGGKEPAPVVDSDLSPRVAIGAGRFPTNIVARMAVVGVSYVGTDGRIHRGQIVVEKRLQREVREIFARLKNLRFPIEKVVPVASYGWDDRRSMGDNNTSGFNYRGVITTTGPHRRLSKHSFGRAIDLNPRLNPFVSAGGASDYPYDPKVPGTLTRSSPVVRVFRSYGWQWGGNWSGAKDYQHFVKP